MQAGRLRQRVDFDAPTASQNGTGEEVITWTPALTRWASVEPLTGREQLISSQTLAQGAVRIRLRWSDEAAAITAKWRARHNGTTYDLQSVAYLGSGRREIEIMARSGLNNG